MNSDFEITNKKDRFSNSYWEGVVNFGKTVNVGAQFDNINNHSRFTGGAGPFNFNIGDTGASWGANMGSSKDMGPGVGRGGHFGYHIGSDFFYELFKNLGV